MLTKSSKTLRSDFSKSATQRINHTIIKFMIENVFIDTSIYEEGYFIASGAIKTLIDAGENIRIRILLPEITEKEVLAHIKERSEDNKVKHIQKLDSSIFKHLPKIKLTIEKLKEQAENAADDITKKFLDNVDRSNTLRIPIQEDLDLVAIIDDYFNKKDPFSEKKKSEFPDAIVLKSLEQWCRENNTTCIVLSKDTDMKNYKSERLIYRDDKDYLSDLAARIQQEKTAEAERIERNARTNFSQSKDVVIELSNWVQQQLSDEVLYCSTLQIEDINDYSISPNIDIEFGSECLLVGMYKGYMMHRIVVVITSEISVNHPDYDTGYYDGEDKQWHFIDDSKNTELKSIIKASVYFTTDENGDFIEIDSINQNKNLSRRELEESLSSEYRD